MWQPDKHGWCQVLRTAHAWLALELRSELETAYWPSVSYASLYYLATAITSVISSIVITAAVVC
jgi:hypothetical protein